MICCVPNETKLTMLLVQPKNRNDGFYIVVIPNDLDAADVEEGLEQVGIEPERVREVSGWKEAEVGLAAAFVAF